MLFEIRDKDVSEVILLLKLAGIETRIRTEEECTWIGDSILEAVFNISEALYDSDAISIDDVTKMVIEIEGMLWRGDSQKLSLLDDLRTGFFQKYVRTFLSREQHDGRVISLNRPR